MPVYPPTTNFSLRLDTTAQTRAAALVAPIATAFAAYIAAHPEVSAGPAVDIAYVYYAAVTVGLSRWKPPSLWAPSYPAGQPRDVPTTASFAPHLGLGTSTIVVAVDNNDVARAAAITAVLGSTAVTILGRACCTGINLLSGLDADSGPFI